MNKLAVLWALFLVGCAGAEIKTETIYLQKGAERVTCGPYATTTANHVMGTTQQLADLNEQRLRLCVSDFQRQGYQRVAAPSP